MGSDECGKILPVGNTGGSGGLPVWDRVYEEVFVMNIIIPMVGGSAVCVDALVYALLRQHLGISAAKAISYIAGAAVVLAALQAGGTQYCTACL